MVCKFAFSLGITTLILLCSTTPDCSANDNSAPAINASGAGMTNEQLEATRPILSALKSVNEAQQAVSQIRDKAKDILEHCTRTAPINSAGGTDDFYGGAQVVSGPNTKMSGKYYSAPKWKLLDIDKDIERQKSFLAETLSENQQDNRPLRSSEETRQKIGSLRAEARALTVPMVEDTNKISALLASAALNQDDMISAAKSLIHSTQSVDAKLKEMEKVLNREQKSK